MNWETMEDEGSENHERVSRKMWELHLAAMKKIDAWLGYRDDGKFAAKLSKDWDEELPWAYEVQELAGLEDVEIQALRNNWNAIEKAIDEEDNETDYLDYCEKVWEKCGF